MTRLHDFVIKQLNKLHRKDAWVNDIIEGGGTPAETDIQDTLELSTSQIFSLASLYYVQQYEKLLGIKPEGTIEERRAVIEAKWKSYGTCTLALIQAVAESWLHYEVVTSFVDGVIIVDITNLVGELDAVREAIEDIKPAHLPLEMIEQRIALPSTDENGNRIHSVYIGCRLDYQESFVLRDMPAEDALSVGTVYTGILTRTAESFTLRSVDE